MARPSPSEVDRIAAAIRDRQVAVGASPRRPRPPEDAPAPGEQDVARTVRAIERLRAVRVRPRKDGLPIGPIVDATQRDAERQRRRLGGLIDVWNDLVPDPPGARARITNLRGGAIAVVVPTSADAFVLDRALREGMLVELRRRAPVPVTRVRVTVGTEPA